MVTSRYRSWSEEILRLTDVNWQAVCAGAWPSGLLLGQLGASLSSEQVQDLFDAVRDELRAGSQKELTAARLRNKLRSLRGVELLPLLFAMAMVAREHGEHHRYWPQFRELLAPDAAVDTVRYVASDLTLCWIRLYEATQYQIYYPQEGLTNIRWPISHAGLLPPDELLVHGFGLSLAKEAPEDDVHPLISGEVDEFQRALAFWLGETNPGSRLARRLFDPSTGLVVAELARQWLTDRWSLLIRGALEEPTERNPRSGGPSYYLELDPICLDIALVLHNARWPGEVSRVTVEHGDRSYNWPLSYKPSADVTRGLRVRIQLQSPQWDGMVYVQTPDQLVKLPIIGTPFRKGQGAMMFDADTGRRTRTWHPESTYYLVLPPGPSSPSWTSLLFSQLALNGVIDRKSVV